MDTRGIVLAGGKGTRLGELTKVTNKHLLPVGDVPMVYHPLKKIIGGGIRDVLLVSGTEHIRVEAGAAEKVRLVMIESVE
jgi:glucose-1-phosphate thymidylyltransferase